MSWTQPQSRLTEQERRAQLLSFGRRHFAQHPFDAMPMEEIARRAGVSKGLLYHYFGGRRGFYLATLSEVIDEALRATLPPAQGTLQARALAMLWGFVRFVHEQRQIYSALVRGGLGSDPEVFAELDRVRRTCMARVLALAGVQQATARQQIAIIGWLSFVESACAEWLEVEGVDQAQLVELLMSALSVVLRSLNPHDVQEAPQAPHLERPVAMEPAR